MKILLLSLCILVSATTFAQAPAIQWQKSFGGSDYEYGTTITATADGGYIVAGETRSNDGDMPGNHGNYDAWVAKITATGSIQWKKIMGGSDYDMFNAVAQTTDGGYILAGYTYSNDGNVSGNHGKQDFWVVKLSNTGALQWQQCYGAEDLDYARTVSQTADGGYIVGGVTQSYDGVATGNHGLTDALIIKLSNTGAIEWKSIIGGSSTDDLSGVKPVPTGGYICSGTSTNGTEPFQAWAIRLDNNGVVKWQKKYGGSGDDFFRSVDLTADGGFIMAGETNSPDGDVSGYHIGASKYYNDIWVVKIDSSGNKQWQKCLGGSGDEGNYSIFRTTGKNYIVAGITASNNGDVSGNHGGYDAWIVKLNPQGNIVWQKPLGGSDFDAGYASAQANDNGYIIAGTSRSTDGDVSGHQGAYKDDIWVVKLFSESAQRISIAASPSDSICTGTPVTFSAVASVVGTYQWQKNHVNVGTNSTTYKDSALQNGDSILCTLTVGDSVFNSNAIGISVTTPAITIIGPGVLCAGRTGTYKATATLAGHPIRYQWKKNNINVGTNSNLYTDSHINNWDSIWCTIVSDAGCTAGAGLTSNKIVVKTLAYGTVTATVTYNPHNYKLCAPGDTTSVTFHAVGQFGGANPSFQWVLNNNIAGTDSSFYTANGLKAGDKVYCRYTSSQKCVTGDVHTVITNTVTLTTKATLTPSITIIQTPDTAVCSGTKVRFKVSSLTGGGENPIYQWMKNNVPVGTNNDIYYDSTLANNDSVWCKMTSHHPCLAGPSTVTSNKKKVTVDNALPPKPSAISGPSSVTANQANISYSVSSINNVTYLWSIPTDASFVTDKHNNSVTVNWGSTAGNIIAQTRNGCGYSAKRVLAVSVSPSLVNAGESSQAIIAAGKASLYPNPAKNFATVSFTAAEAGKYMVQVTDANGRVLQVKETNAVKGRNTININVNGYAKGSYFVRLSNKDGKQQATFTLVVAK